MSDPFASPKRRLARARNHIDNVEMGIRVFLETQPYERTVERNTQRFEEHKIRLTKPIPDDVTDLAYEALEAMRSSLDQATYAVAVACNSKRPDRIHFPVADAAADFENNVRGWLTDFPTDMLALFRSFKAHQAGNELIWALNRIRRQGMHRLIVPVVTATEAFAHSVTINSPHFVELPPLKWDSEKNEVIFARTNPGSDLNYKLDFMFFIIFGEVEGVAGEPIIETLREIAAEVERIVLAIETEARRLNLIT
jgi:hypothetical protein